MGSYNTFEPKSRVSSSVTIGDYCTVGAACTATADQAASEGDFLSVEALLNSDSSKSQEEAMTTIASGSTSTRTATEHLSDYTVVYGSANERRKWSGEGKIQQTALMHKHLAYLSETLPKYSRLKLFT